MRYRTLGNTGLAVSEIGFGTIPVLRGNIPVLPDYYNLDNEAAVHVMEHALNLGCNLFDTAIVPEYGDAEIKVGLLSEKVGRKKIIISDKARYFTGNEMYTAVLTSCENLGTYADLYFSHQVDPSNEDEVFGPYGAADALAEQKAEGNIRFAGIATHYYDILLRGAKDPRIDVLQGSGNLLERGMLDRIAAEPLFRQKGFLLNKVYAAGILPSFFPVKTLIEGVLSYPISCALIGLGTIEEIDMAMGTEYIHTRKPTFEEILSTLEKEFSPIACDRCQRCSCVYGTEIHTIFRQYNYHFLGKDNWALRKLDMGIRESALACKKCVEKPCLRMCPKGLRIPQIIEEIKGLTQAHVWNSVVYGK